MPRPDAQLQLICGERLTLLHVVVKRTEAFVKATRAEKTARTEDELRRLRHLALETQKHLQSARRELSEHKRRHGCGGREKAPPKSLRLKTNA